MQPEHRSHSEPASGLELPQSGGLFDPAKHLLDPLSGVDRLAVALMPSGSPVDGRADVGDKVTGVVALVGGQRLARWG